MDVDRPLVDGRRRGGRVDGAQDSAGALLDDADRPTGRPPQVHEVNGSGRVGPVPAVAPSTQQAAIGQDGAQVLGAGPEPTRQVVVDQRGLRSRCAQVPGQDVGVLGVEHGGLDGPSREGLGVADDVLVQGILTGDQDSQGWIAAAAGSPDLLPERRARARPSDHQDGVEAADVDTELEGVRGSHPEQAAGAQVGFQGSPLLGQVATAVGAHPIPLDRALADRAGQDLHGPSGPGEGQRRYVRVDQAGHQVRRLGQRPAEPGHGLRRILGDVGQGWRVPQHDVHRSRVRCRPGRPRQSDSEQPGGGRTRVGHGGRCRDERRRCPVQRRDPPQPPQHERHVRAEDAAVGVCLVDDDELQAAQEAPPRLVPGQDRVVQHVRVGHDPSGVGTGPGALLVGGVAVHGSRPQPGQPQRTQAGQLVVGQGLRGAQVENRRTTAARSARVRSARQSGPASRRRPTCPTRFRWRRARGCPTRPDRRCGPGAPTAGRCRPARRPPHVRVEPRRPRGGSSAPRGKGESTHASGVGRQLISDPGRDRAGSPGPGAGRVAAPSGRCASCATGPSSPRRGCRRTHRCPRPAHVCARVGRTVLRRAAWSCS